MTITYREVDYGGAFDETLGSSPRLGSIEGLSEVAALGEVGTSGLEFDDEDGTLGHSSDGLTGFKLLFVEDDAAPSGDRIIYAGLIGERSYGSEDSLVQGDARRVKPALRDLNALVDLRELRGKVWKRSRETAEVRLRALLGSAYFSGISDQGLVTYPTHTLDATDYRGQHPSQVLNDIVLPVGWNWWVRWNETASVPELYLDNSERSDGFASTLRLSNVATDRDSWCDPPTLGVTKTYAVSGKSVLTRDPTSVYSGVGVPYSKGTYYEESATVASAFIARDGSAPSANVKTRAQAQKIARKFLNHSQTETDRIETAVEVPAANVNDIRAGHLISARFRQLPGYTSFSYFRVVRRSVGQPMRSDDRYRIGLTLAPANPFTCVGLSDVNEAHGTVTGGVSVVLGSVMWAHATISGFPAGARVDTAVSTIPVYNPTNANDGSATTYSLCPGEVLRHAGSVALDWTATLDASYILCSTKGTIAVGSIGWRSYPPTLIEYWDGTDWRRADGSIHYAPTSPTPRYWTYTFRAPITTTKLRWRYLFSSGSMFDGLWSFNNLGTRVYEMLLVGAAA